MHVSALLFVFMVSSLLFSQNEMYGEPADPVAQRFHSTGEMKVTSIRWATDPPEQGRKSLFDGRCSKPSDYVITFVMEADEPSLGHLSGEASHCSQIEWAEGRPSEGRYSDGIFKYVTAGGDELQGTYTNGTGSWNEATQSGTCHDELVFTGGTGPFTGMSGKGEDLCTFGSFEKTLAGEPSPIETIASIVLHRGEP